MLHHNFDSRFTDFHNFDNWKLKNSCKLRKRNGKFFIDFYFEKEAPSIKSKGKEIGLDCGYKKLLISSENKLYDTGLQPIYEKISRKKQGSKRFKKALIERDNKINESINLLNFNELKTNDFYVDGEWRALTKFFQLATYNGSPNLVRRACFG